MEDNSLKFVEQWMKFATYTSQDFRGCNNIIKRATGFLDNLLDKLYELAECIDNSGHESQLTIGLEYQFRRNSKNSDMIDVMLDNGEFISVFSDRFKIVQHCEISNDIWEVVEKEGLDSNENSSIF